MVGSECRRAGARTSSSMSSTRTLASSPSRAATTPRSRFGLADESGGEDGRRPVVDLGRGPFLHDAPLVHEDDAVGHRERFFLVVRDVEERGAQLLLDAPQLELHRLAQLEIECGQRLVQQEHRAVGRSTPAPAPPAAPDRPRAARERGLDPRQAHQIEHAAHAILLLPAEHPASASGKAMLSKTILCGKSA